MIVGEASVLITPDDALFRTKLEAGTAPAFGGLTKDAEKAGEESGSKLSKGFGKGTSHISSALGALGLPLGSFGGHLEKTAASMGQVEKHGSGVVSTLSTIGGGALAGATAAVGAFGVASVIVAAKGQQVTTSIANSAKISTNAAKEISSAFTDTMGHAQFSGQEMGKAYAEVAGVLGEVEGRALKAGEASKFMASSSDLADAAGIELGASTNDLAKILQAYHLRVDESAKASDILYSTHRLTGISIDQLTTLLTRMKGKLGDLAPSLGESTALVASLAKEGVQGRQSMTALNGSFTTLVGGGKPAVAMAKELGINIFNSQGKFVGMKSIIEQLNPKLSELTQQSQLQATKALFGASANKQMLDIVLKGPQAFEQSTKAVTKSGAAHEAAKRQAETFSGQIKILKATAIDLAEKFGNILIPKLVMLGKALAEGVVWLGKHKTAATVLAGTIATVLGAAIAVFVTQKAIAFGQGIAGMIGNMGKLVSGIQTGVAKIVGYFTAESGASEATAAKIAESSTATNVSFTSTGTAAAAASAEVGTSVGGMAVAVEGADTAIETANVAAGASFAALGVAAVAGAAVVYGAVKGIEAGLESITGESQKVSELLGGNQPGESGKEGEAFAKTHGGYGNQAILKTGGGIMAFFEAKGLTPAQAAGIVGNIQQESGFNPKAIGKEGARGLAQGLGNRAETGTTTQQLEQIWRELSGNGLAAIKKTRTPSEAARAFEKEFEKAEGGGNLSQREKYATEALAAHPKAADHSKAHGKALEQNTAAIQNHTKTLKSLPAEATKGAAKHAAHHASTKLFTPHGGSTGFFEAPGTNYTEGKTEEIAARLDALGKAEKTRLTGVSGYRTPAHSVAVGGFADDPHTKGLASDTEGAQTIPEATLRKFGLTRPFPGAKEADHIQLLPGVAALKKGSAEVGVGGLQLKKVAAVFEAEQKAVAAHQKKEATRIAGDQKVGTATLNKMVAAIHSGGVKELEKVVGGTHEKTMKKLEAELDKDHKDAMRGLAGTVEKEHASALSKMVAKLTEVHKKALEALQIALVKAAEKAKAEGEKREDTINTQAAENAATQIADSTKVVLDHAAEGGLTGAELVAAQAQTNLDSVKQANDAAVGAAKLAVDNAAGAGELPEADAQHSLVNAENAAKVAEAQAQQTLDVATNAATEASKAQAKASEEQTKAAEANTKATEEQTKKTEEVKASAPPMVFNINGTGLSATEVVSEVAWQAKIGALPSDPPPVTIPVAA
jgi:TP901 family phage tail tape measure protein